MSFRGFVASAYALLVETYHGLNMDLLSAIDRTNEALGLSDGLATPAGSGVPSPADNAAALAALEKMIP